jgi:uncharacterized protein (DUF58 family)
MIRRRFSAWLGRLARPVVWRRAHPAGETTVVLRGWMAVAALAGALVWYLATPTAEAAMALAALAGVVGAGFVWAVTLAQNVAGQRSLRYAAMQVGEELEEAIRLSNAAPLPVLWAEVVDQSDLPGYTVSSVRAVDAGTILQWRAHALCTQRGQFTLGRWELRMGDPFGLFLVQQRYQEPQTLIVYPPLAALPRYLLPHTPTLGEHRLLRQPLPAETVNAITTRPHVPGDPLRRMHWPTTARRGSPFTKVFEPEATHRIWLITDFDPAAHLGLAEDSTEELLVLLAASLAAQLLQQRLAVGLLAADRAEAVIVPPRPGVAHLWEHLRALAPLHPAADTPPLSQLLLRAQGLVSARDLLIILTPSLEHAWSQSLARVAHRGIRAEAILIDPASFGGAAAAQAYLPALAGLGVVAHVVRRGEVKPLSAVYGALRRWEFITLGTGRAVALQTPRGALSLEAQLASLQAQTR